MAFHGSPLEAAYRSFALGYVVVSQQCIEVLLLKLVLKRELLSQVAIMVLHGLPLETIYKSFAYGYI